MRRAKQDQYLAWWVIGGAAVVWLILNIPLPSREGQTGAVFTVRTSDFSSAPSLVCRGDIDCNGAVNQADLGVFSTLLVNPNLYHTQHPDCPKLNADINIDGQVNNFDIGPFQTLIATRRSTSCLAEAEVGPSNANPSVSTSRTFVPRATEPLQSKVVTAGVEQQPTATAVAESNSLLDKKGVVQDLVTPSGAKFALYMPADYRPGNPLIVSLHGTKIANNPQTYLYEIGPYTLYNNGGFDWGGPSWKQLADNRAKYPAFAVVAPHLDYAGDSYEHYNMCVQESDEQHILEIVTYLQQQGVTLATSPKYITGHSSGGSLAASIEFRHPDIFTQAVIRHSSLENSTNRQTNQTYFSAVWDYNDTVRNCTYAYNAAGACQAVPGSCTGTYHWDESSLPNNHLLFTNGNIDWTYHADTLNSIAAARAEGTPLPKVRWIEWFSPDPHVNPFTCDSNLAGGIERRACHDESRDVAADFFFANKSVQGDLDGDGDRDCRDYRAQVQSPRDINHDGVVNDADTRFFYNNVTVDGNQMWQGGGNQTTLASAWPCSAN